MRVRFSFSARRTRKIETGNNHRVPFPKLARDVIRISDVILEVIDARFIEKTRNITFEDEIKAQGKVLVYVFNKADLVDINELKKNVELQELRPYVFFSCKSVIGRKRLRDLIKIESKRKSNNYKTAHVGIIGYPNVGKSSLINLLAGRKSAGTSAQAGFTRGIQKIRFARNILILDSPGVIKEGEDSTTKSSDLKKHAEIGVRTYDKVKNPDFVLSELMKAHPLLFEAYYGIDAKGDVEVLLDVLGRKKGFMLRGNNADLDKTARYVLKAWQNGEIKVIVAKKDEKPATEN